MFGQEINRQTESFFDGDFIESDGVSASGDPAADTGTMTLHARDTILGESNDFQIDISGNGFGAVDFSTEPTDRGPGNPDTINTVELNGEFSVNLLGGFIPASGSTFEILTANNGFISTFDTETLPTLGGAIEWLVDYGASAVTLQAFLVGYYDDDGDGADFLVWQRDDGTSAGLAAWQATYGSGGGSFQAATTVPEPMG